MLRSKLHWQKDFELKHFPQEIPFHESRNQKKHQPTPAVDKWIKQPCEAPTDERSVFTGGERALQGYLAYKKLPPPGALQ